MANAILAVASKKLETSGAAYQLCRKARMAIYMQAPSWRYGQGKSHIPDSLIEKQRRKFKAIHGDEFGQL